MRWWFGEYSTRKLPVSAVDSRLVGSYTRKLDLILLDKNVLDDVTWKSPKVIGEFTMTTFAKSKTISHTINTKAYLLLSSQPWRRFAIVISIANWQLRVHLYDRAGTVRSKPYDFHANYNSIIHIMDTLALADRRYLGFDPTIHISPRNTMPDSNEHVLGWIEASDSSKRYQIKAILASSIGFVGRGTVCYHVSEQNENGQEEEYVLKDYWAAKDVLEHEVDILKDIKELVGEEDIGLPEFVDAWTVQFDGKDDETDHNRAVIPPLERPERLVNRVHKRILMKPVAKPITHFSSLKEFVTGFLDIVKST
jgi:hypothetical protein